MDVKIMFVESLGIPMSDALLSAFNAKLGQLPSISKYDDETYCSYREAGVTLIFDEKNQLDSVQLFGRDRDPEFKCYQGDLPEVETFFHSKDEVVSLLGPPEKEGAGVSLPILSTPPWIRYSRASYDIHFQFKDDFSEISLLSLRSGGRGQIPESSL